jgi:hypothetical protein
MSFVWTSGEKDAVAVMYINCGGHGMSLLNGGVSGFFRPRNRPEKATDTRFMYA